ncbi:MAG: ABC transporter ATP-binding protein [Nitrospirae bacterium]|nr:MAG: ABC transporter ATP-binding protein [Nitrospirota bacterium]
MRQVTCSYIPNQPAIHDISLALHQGEILCLLGPSGCGKTTTLRVIAGFERVTAGEIVLNGTVVASPRIHLPPERRRVGMVFQEYALFPHLRVAENIGFGLQACSIDQRRARIHDLLTMMDLVGFERRYPHELSGGQQQRVALARALAPNPVLLLLDEPFSNLDPDMTYKMQDELHTLLKRTNTTTLLVTHDHEEAFAMADQIAVLHEGRLIQCDTPETIYHLPATPFVAEFVGQADFLPGTVTETGVMTEVGVFPRPIHYHGTHHVYVMVRPDDLEITATGQGTARITSRQFRGSENLYTIRLASGRLVHCTTPSTTVFPHNLAVELKTKATHTVVFDQSSYLTS